MITAAAFLRGPSVVDYFGTRFLQRETTEIPVEQSTFDLEVEPFGVVQSRRDIGKIPINLTPAGRIQEVARLINIHANRQHGSLINIDSYPVTVNAGTDVLTTGSAHFLTAGDEVMVHAVITMPGGLSKSIRYYAGAITTNTLKLYGNEADAITGGGSGLIDITSVGSAVVLDVARSLTITTLSGLQIKYYCVAVTKLGDLEFSAVKPMLGQTEFTAFVRPGQDPDDLTDAYYKISQVTPPTVLLDPNDIKTQYPLINWAFDPAWTGLHTKDGAKVSFDIKSEPLPSDAFGEDALGRIFTDIMPTVTASPQGLTESEIKAGLQLQTTVRGGNLSGGLLELATGYYTFSIADAILNKAPLQFSSKEQRAGSFEWKAQKKFTAGAVDPTYELTVN